MDILAYAAAVAAAKKNGGGSGGGSGADLLNANGIIKQEVLPEGYPYVGEGVILPETTLEFFEDQSEYELLGMADMVIGNTYTVNWNGTEYKCVAQPMDFGFAVPAVGNVGVTLGEEGTGEPFIIVSMPAELEEQVGMANMGALIPLDGSKGATVSIVGETVTKMDAKFLPDVDIPTVSLLEVGNINRIIQQEYSVRLHNDLMKIAEVGYGRVEYEVTQTTATGTSVTRINQIVSGATEDLNGSKRVRVYGFYPWSVDSFIGVSIVSLSYGGVAYIDTCVSEFESNVLQ